MPVGPYPDFASCVAAQKRRGKSDKEARKICGKIERDQNTTSEIEKFQSRQRSRKPSPKDRARAEKFFRDRVPLTDNESESLSGRAKQQAFWAAQVGDLRVVDMVLKSLKRAIEFGEDLETWKRKIGPAMRAAWGPGRRDRSGRMFDQGHRLALIYRNSMQSAHNGSRFKALRRPQTMALRPFWQFTNPTPESDICKELAGTVRPANDPWWNTHQPPMHHNCFPAGTLVLTRSGQVPIEKIEVGDLVMTHRGRWQPVTETMKTPSPESMIHLSTTLGSHLSPIGTAAHPALTDRGWVPFANLRVGDRLLYVGGRSNFEWVAGDRHRDVSLSVQEQQPLGRTSGVAGSDLDREIQIGCEDVDEHQHIPRLNRMLEFGMNSHSFENVEHNPLGSGRFDAAIPMPIGIFSPGLFTSDRCAFDDIGIQQSAALFQLVGDRLQSWIGFFREALCPVRMGLAPFAKYFAGSFRRFLAARGVVAPLVGDSSGRTHINPEQLEHVAHWLGADTEFIGTFAQRHATIDVEGVEDFRQACAVFLEQSINDCALVEVVGVEQIRSDVSHVFNLSVAYDESYVANAMLVHNCVSRIKALSRQESARFGVTEDPPDVAADDGFGEPATDATNAVVQSNLSAIDNALRQLFNAKTRQGP